MQGAVGFGALGLSSRRERAATSLRNHRLWADHAERTADAAAADPDLAFPEPVVSKWPPVVSFAIVLGSGGLFWAGVALVAIRFL